MLAPHVLWRCVCLSVCLSQSCVDLATCLYFVLYRPMFIIIDCYLVLHHKYEINVMLCYVINFSAIRYSYTASVLNILGLLRVRL